MAYSSLSGLYYTLDKVVDSRKEVMRCRCKFSLLVVYTLTKLRVTLTLRC